MATSNREEAGRKEARGVRAEERQEQHRVEQRNLVVEIMILAQDWHMRANLIGPFMGKASSYLEVANSETASQFGDVGVQLRRALVRADLAIRSKPVRRVLDEMQELLTQHGSDLGVILERTKTDPTRSGDQLVEAIGLSLRTVARFERKTDELQSTAGDEFRL